MPKRAISEIRIGQRVRKTFGDIEALAESIRECGLLQPVGIRPDGSLVCGERRIRACKKLKWTEIPVHICQGLDDELRYLEAERDENTCREELVPTEALALQERLEPLYAKLAEAAQIDAGSHGKKGGRGKKKTLPTTSGKGNHDHSKETSHRAAASTGYSAATLKKVAECKQAAKTKPELFGKFEEDLSKPKCKVDRVHKNYQAAVKAESDRIAAKSAVKAIADTSEDGIIFGDFRKECLTIPTASVALIFTDPPYDRESLPLFASLADMADRVLVDGGSLITFCGQYVMDDVMDMLSKRLQYFWTCCCQHTGDTAQMREYGIKIKWKPMLWFVKGQFRRDRETWVEDLVVSQQEKDQHAWQQSVIEASYFIEKLTRKGEMVLDPFCGGGTTAVAAKQLGRKWVTYDVDPQAVATARKRLQA